MTSIILSNRLHKELKNVVGMFVNTLPVSFSVKGNINTYFRELKSLLLSIYEYQELPFLEIAEIAGIQDKSVINTSFVFQADGEKTLKLEEQELTAKWINTKTAKFDLSMEVTPIRDGCRVRLEYNCAKYDEKLIDSLLEAYEKILAGLASTEIKDVEDISVLSEKEKDKLLYEFNDTAIGYPKDKCVHELFTEQAHKTPDKTALVFEDKEFTYRQLDEMSNSLAHLLREKGVGRNDVVPIIAKRSWHVIVAMLGVLKAGGAYMLIDYQYPAERISYLIQECRADIVLVYGCKYNSLTSIKLEEIDYMENIEPLFLINEYYDILCAIHTSGSLGVPKVTVLAHGNIVHYINASHELFNEVEQSIATTTITFDAFTQETIVALCRKIPIILLNEIQMSNQVEFERILSQYENSFLFQTPTKLLAYIRNSESGGFLETVRNFVVGGEVFPKELYDKISFHNSDGNIFNIYGPTETTICVTYKKIKNSGGITIGTPIANTQIYILDPHQRLLPIGVAGELCIAGDGVGKGYLNRPELTADRFLPNPFATEENGHGKTLYRTGDLARFREDGEIEYLGRIDTQVKIRGLRIELGEIESVMGSFDGILLCAAADKRDENGRQYLVGYYTSEKTIDERQLRKHLSAKLPQYMVPNYFARLEEMPMTASGKTDRKNLPLPDFTISQEQYREPETETERKLALIWSELLQADRIGRADGFFELGGDSLLAITMITRVEEIFQIQISVKEIMEHSTLEQLAEVIEGIEGQSAGITARHKGKYVILPQQKAIYAAAAKEPEKLLYNIPACISLADTIDKEKLKASITAVVEKHESLKTFFSVHGDEVYGIYDGSAEIMFEEYSDQTITDFFRPFDLRKAPLMRVGFTKEKLLFDIHHIIADGESLNIIIKDIFDVYRGEEPENSKIDFSDYAAHFAETDFTVHKAFYKEMLKGELEPVSLPEKRTGGPTDGRSKIFFLSERLVKDAKKYAGKNELTDTMLYFGAFGILLSKYTGKEEVLTSVILTNRQHKELRNVVGMFVNTLPAFFRVNGKCEDYFNRIRDLLLNLYKYQELPFLEIAETIGIKDKSFINTSFVYQAGGEKVLETGETKLSLEFVDTNTAKFDLSMEVTPAGGGCKVRLEYNYAKYDEKLMDDLFKAYERILAEIADMEGGHEKNIVDITILSEEEKDKLLYRFNNTVVDYAKDKCIHELFVEQAHKTPDKAALVFEDKEFTYRQIDEMSNSLAHLLREKGVGRNDVVPIIAKRSWHVIVAMLGILKAGGAYMLIDYQYPAERISYLIQECKADIVLVYGCKYNSLKSIKLEEIDYMENIEPLFLINEYFDILCAIHTSGSSGVPKVTILTHGNIVHYINASYELFNGVKQSIATTIITFDAFTQETMVSLCRQVPVILLNDIQMGNQAEFEKLIDKYEDSFLFQTPTKLLTYIRNIKSVDFLKKIKSFVIGGEVFPQDLYDKIRFHNVGSTIFNIYGPTETSICVTYKKLDSSNINIGTPIANTQIYILDTHQHLLPIGVAGELCIAGDGVGKGYLNRPELTAERFLPNPFATVENGHGKTLYRTGDLARFREDGEIEYLGRMDTQVKIRGLRIELGEIESVMGSFDGIMLCAAADKRDENGRQYLVGYYTSTMAIDERQLRKHLSAKLPQYMVPNYFVRLEEMLMTASGKTDRKNLPLPDFAVSQEQYREPETEKEKLFCRILERLLGYGQIGVEDDFFANGGDSLRAIEYTARLQDEGVSVSLQNIFDYPTVRSLCNFLENGAADRTTYCAGDFEKYQSLLNKNKIDTAFVPEKKPLGNILLTGATGFLGAHILDALMKEEEGKIYCLVRSAAPGDGERRIRETLRYYFDGRYEQVIGERIIPVPGDVENEGLAPDMPQDIKTVIHAAASVKHYGAYSYFERVNVQGTQNAVNFAKKAGAGMIHISTISVSGNSLADDFDVYRSEEEKYFAETSFYIDQPLENVYIRSKFEAEKAVFDAMLEGMDVKIIRVGNLTNRASDYKFQPNYRENAFLTRVKAALEFGLMPDYLMELYSEFSPVDLTAEGVVKIAQYAGGQSVFHLYSNRPIYHDRLSAVLGQLGIHMKIVDQESFNAALRNTLKSVDTEYIYEAFQNDMDESGKLVYDTNIHIQNDFTVWFLKRLGFEWNEINLEYIRGYIGYFRGLGFLK